MSNINEKADKIMNEIRGLHVKENFTIYELYTAVLTKNKKKIIELLELLTETRISTTSKLFELTQLISREEFYIRR